MIMRIKVKQQETLGVLSDHCNIYILLADQVYCLISMELDKAIVKTKVT